VRDDAIIDNEFLEVLKTVAPGTTLHEGLENILRAKTGALIVIGDGEEVIELISGGFKIDAELHPYNLYELAKMDGAIIISKDVKKIMYANVQLLPNPLIPSYETGIRHRSAERVAKQTNQLVIAISQRRNIITLYKGSMKYVLRDVGVILTKANQAIQTLEKYKSVLDQALINLSALEFEDLVTLYDVAMVIQRTEMVERVAAEIERYICELGDEGRLISMQLDELMVNVDNEGLLVMEDYWIPQNERSPENIREQIKHWAPEDLLDLNLIIRALGYSGNAASLDTSITPRGYRILGKIPRLPMPVIQHLVEVFGTLQNILRATTDELDEVEGIGEVRAHAIKDGLKRLREHVLMDRKI
jgi:diadenylate cyclase